MLIYARKEVKVLKRIVVNTFDQHCRDPLYSLKFHWLHHKMERIEKFESLEKLDSFSLVMYNGHVKYADRPISQRRCTSVGEKVNILEIQN